MKAVVFEILGRNMIVLDNEGGFRKLSFDGVSRVGDEIEIAIEKKLVFAHFKQIAAVAAMIIMMFGLGYAALGYYTPYAYIDVDINPSVELVLNKYMRVLDVQKLNADAEKVASDVNSFKNKDLEQAVDMLLDNVQTQQIFKRDQENVIMYTVSGTNQQKLSQINRDLHSITIKKLPKLIKAENIFTQTIPISKHNQAKKIKISPGRVLLYEKLKSVKPDAKIEDVAKTPIRDTLKLIRQYKQAKKSPENKLTNKNKPTKQVEQNKNAKGIKKIKKDNGKKQLPKNQVNNKLQKNSKALNKNNNLKTDKQPNDKNKVKDSKNREKTNERIKQNIKDNNKKDKIRSLKADKLFDKLQNKNLNPKLKGDGYVLRKDKLKALEKNQVKK